ISAYDKDPTSGGLAIWADTPFAAVRAPDGAAPGGAVDGWDAGGGNTGAYTITLTGVSGQSCGGACTCSGDIDGSGCVDGGDIQGFVTCNITGTGNCTCANISNAAFVAKLLQGCPANCP